MRVLYLGPPPSGHLPPVASVADLMLATGRNTGNLLIGDAIHRQLAAATFRTAEQLLRDQREPLTTPRLLALDKLDRAVLERSFDVVVIGAANFLFEQFDFSGWARFLESVDLPCVMIGLGAQAPDYDSPVSVPEGTARLVRIVAERSTSLGVRGRFTADTLERMGVTNVRVIGCPSMYWSCRSALSFKPRVPADRPLAVCANGSTSGTEHASNPAAARRVAAMLARLPFDRGYPYVLQNETDLMEIRRQDGSAGDEARIRALMDQCGVSEMAPDEFVRLIRERMRVFADAAEWLEAMKAFDLVIGTRFHGCLVGLLAGVPSVVFVHDARTREMCELLEVPRIDIRHVSGIDARALYESVNLEPLETRYRALYRGYVAFLEENDLQHRLE